MAEPQPGPGGAANARFCNGGDPTFQLSVTSTLVLLKGDITEWVIDSQLAAIVLASRLLIPDKVEIFLPSLHDGNLSTALATRGLAFHLMAIGQYLREFWRRKFNGLDKASSCTVILLLRQSLIPFLKTIRNLDNLISEFHVNTTSESMLEGGSVHTAIHGAAGPFLGYECRQIPEVRPRVRCPIGEARMTSPFMLRVAYVVHTVGPAYSTDPHPEMSLRSAYRSCLNLAKTYGVQHIAFPAISCGFNGYPLTEASRIAISTVMEFPADFREVYFVLYSDDAFYAWMEAAIELFQ